MARLFSQEALGRLTSNERKRLVWMQMQPRHTRYGGYMPDDCSECGACGYPILGSGWCNNCSNEFDRLKGKAMVP